ncbi:MAG: hypothetical protein LBG75_01490 [Candidatus Nomurabacteria bacterium]|jgi:hypothetical protein|nr:hypothetical protein [Candidatus Nomurabacteria bacterium]
MSYLAKLLGVEAHPLELTVSMLEERGGGTAIDARLVGEIHERMAMLMLELGLDPANTTGSELYKALNNRFASDFEQLLKTAKFDKSALEKLFDKPEFPKFWQNSLFVGVAHDGGVISFNVYDALSNHRSGAPYGSQAVAEFKEALGAELVARYERQFGAKDILTTKLKHDMMVASNSKSKKENN